MGKAAAIEWNMTEETPSEHIAAPVVTGISAPKARDAKPDTEWTVEELKAGKPKLVYFFYSDVSNPMAEDYKFARKFEFSGTTEKSVEQINKNWTAIKRELAVELDRKIEKNQSRIEFWSFTGRKMDSVTQKEQQILNPSPFAAKLKDMERKNRELCNAEIKRLADEEFRRKKQSEETGAK